MRERNVLEHVHRTRNADNAPLCLLFRQPLIIEEPFVFILHQIRQCILSLLTPGSAFTAVTGHMEAFIRKTADCQRAIVGTQAAAARRYLTGKGLQLLRPKQCADASGYGLFLSQQGTAVGTHYTGDIRPYNGSAGQQLERPQHSLIIKGSALYDDITTQILAIADFDYLLQGILDNRVRQPGRKVGQRSAFLLHLLHLGIHEHSAA
ncbi:hypothetical protein D3C75_603770 [compost metagenome]